MKLTNNYRLKKQGRATDVGPHKVFPSFYQPGLTPPDVFVPEIRGSRDILSIYYPLSITVLVIKQLTPRLLLPFLLLSCVKVAFCHIP